MPGVGAATAKKCVAQGNPAITSWFSTGNARPVSVRTLLGVLYGLFGVGLHVRPVVGIDD
ncbi:hypothetical protein ACFR97_00505 [Haloplanus litoreus]|uniref:Uncharacterized protein n=1 Tax=Haloplanus litoreus TaxID=767515 RepID=A0ABD5ZWR0_9EURY